MFLDTSSGAMVNGIRRVRYSHDAMIDLMIQDPSIRQNEIAAIFDRSPTWISLIVNSDAFQARLEQRRTELVDPEIIATHKERLSAIADVSLQRLLEKVGSPVQLVSDDFLLRTAEYATKALGYGARPGGELNTNIALVIQVPEKIASPTEWARVHSPAALLARTI